MAEIDVYRCIKTSKFGDFKGKDKNVQRKEHFEETGGRGHLYPSDVDMAISKGSDGAMYVDGVDDTPEISEDEKKKGVSVTGKFGKFGWAGWAYFLIPKETPVPAGLDILLSETKQDPLHHSIRCKNRMRLDVLHGALDNLARAAIVKAIELKRPSLYFSSAEQ